MKSRMWLTFFALLTAASACAGPVAFRLASLPASAEPGQKLVLCATNIGTGVVDVTLEFVNVKTGGMVAEKTVRLEPLGAGAAAQPCMTTAAEAVAAAAVPNAGAPTYGRPDGSVVCVGWDGWSRIRRASAGGRGGDGAEAAIVVPRGAGDGLHPGDGTGCERGDAHGADDPAQPHGASSRRRAGVCARDGGRAS